MDKNLFPTFTPGVKAQAILIINEEQFCLCCNKSLNQAQHESEVCWSCETEMELEAEAELARQDMIHFEIYGE